MKPSEINMMSNPISFVIWSSFSFKDADVSIMINCGREIMAMPAPKHLKGTDIDAAFTVNERKATSKLTTSIKISTEPEYDSFSNPGKRVIKMVISSKTVNIENAAITAVCSLNQNSIRII